MLTWEMVRAYIRRQFSPVQEAEGWLSLRCEFPNAGFQTVLASLREHRVGGAALELAAPVGDTDRIPATDALAYNQNAPLGALVLRGDSVLLRHVIALKDITTDAIDDALGYVASEAMRLRMRTAVAAVGPELFAYLAS